MRNNPLGWRLVLAGALFIITLGLIGFSLAAGGAANQASAMGLQQVTLTGTVSITPGTGTPTTRIDLPVVPNIKAPVASGTPTVTVTGTVTTTATMTPTKTTTPTATVSPTG